MRLQIEIDPIVLIVKKEDMKYLFILFTIFPVFSFAQDLTSEVAKKISARAVQYSSQKNWKVSIAIVNSEGNLVYFERGDGTYVGSIDSSIEKAKSANAFQRPTSAFAEAVKSGRTGLVTGDKIVAIEGGVPINYNGKHAGAIGISGARAIEDEEIANEALKSILEK